MTKSIFTNRYLRFRQLMIGARKKAGLTQAQLARKIARPQSFVSKYELGERRLDVIEFLEVAGALGVDPARMLRSIDSGKTQRWIDAKRAKTLSSPHPEIRTVRNLPKV